MRIVCSSEDVDEDVQDNITNTINTTNSSRSIRNNVPVISLKQTPLPTTPPQPHVQYSSIAVTSTTTSTAAPASKKLAANSDRLTFLAAVHANTTPVPVVAAVELECLVCFASVIFVLSWLGWRMCCVYG
jgi:hypothetical protein